jgi:indoleacetamide hydrolase
VGFGTARPCVPLALGLWSEGKDGFLSIREASQPDNEASHHIMDRRRFLRAIAGAAGVATGLWASPAARGLAAARPRGTRHNELLDLTAREAVAALRAGDLKARTYASALLARARSLKQLNAVLSHDRDQVLAAAHAADRRRSKGAALGPLHGLPIVIKDNINTRALATTAGTPPLIDNRPRRNAEVVRRLRAAGAIVLAKTNMNELALGVTSDNAAFGPVRNPYDPTKIPGGSSGGNGCAVAARIAPAAIGTDTAGSVRIPAALCGIAALRPTVGRYPRTGNPDAVTDIVPISYTRDTPGPMARTVADVALLDAVITGRPVRLVRRHLRGVRLGVDRRNFFEDLDPKTESVIDHALRRIQARGAVLVEIEVQGLQSLNAAVGVPVAFFEAGIALPKYLAKSNTGVSLEELVAGIASPESRFLASLIGAIPESTYLDALHAHRPRLQAAYRHAFKGSRLDALVFPTTPLPARPIGQDTTVELNGAQVATDSVYTRHTDPGSNAGIPGLNVPVGLTRGGLPVGLGLDGPTGSDRGLLAIGLAIEEEFGSLPAPNT